MSMPKSVENVQEGSIPVTGGLVWYQIINPGEGIRLLTLHGGPGVDAIHHVTLLLEANEPSKPLRSQKVNHSGDPVLLLDGDHLATAGMPVVHAPCASLS